MDSEEGTPEWGHCIHLQVTSEPGEFWGSVVDSFRVISLMSVQDELRAQVLHRESNNRSSLLALQKICSCWKALNLSFLSFIICKVMAKGCFLQICLGRASCSTESIHKTDFRLRRTFWKFQIQQPVIMHLLWRCENQEIYWNNIDLKPGSAIESETASKHRHQFNFSSNWLARRMSLPNNLFKPNDFHTFF